MAAMLNAEKTKVIQSKSSKNKTDETVEYEIVVNQALQKEMYEKLYSVKAKEVEIKGFRKGEAPRTMIEPQIYSDLTKELTNALVNSAVQELITDEKIVTIIMPEVSDISFSMVESPLKFTVKITALKEYTIPELSKYKVEVKAEEADDAEVENTFNTIWEDWKKKAKEEDLEKYKEATDIWVEEVMKIPGVKSIPEMKKMIREELTHTKFHQEEDKKISEVLTTILKDMGITVPASFLAESTEKTMQMQKEKIAKYGMKWEDYLKNYKTTEDGFKKDVEESVITQYKEEVFWTFFIKTRNLQIDPSNKEDAMLINYAGANMGIQNDQKLDQATVNRLLRMAVMYKAYKQFRSELGIVPHNHEEEHAEETPEEQSK